MSVEESLVFKRRERASLTRNNESKEATYNRQRVLEVQ